jgi:Bacterial PH domain
MGCKSARRTNAYRYSFRFTIYRGNWDARLRTAGDTIVGNELRVKTLAVTLKYDLTEIRGAMAVSPEDIRFGKTIRLLGAGWPFKPYGYFSNAKLGRFLAFVTDWQKMDLVIFPDKRLLVSPDNPKIILDRFTV